MDLIATPSLAPAPTRRPLLTYNSYDSAMEQQAINLSSPRSSKQRHVPGRRAIALAREVRNPLTCINLAVDMLTIPAAGTDQKAYIDMIAKSAKRIDQLIKELLECQEIANLSHTHY
jgi:nitrogen-specific signal transduction histidine kinase